MQIIIIKVLMTFMTLMSIQMAEIGTESVEERILTDEEIWINNEIAEMDLSQKFGQMILTGLDSTVISENEIRMIESGQVGGILFLKHNIKTDTQFQELIASIPSTKVPLVLSVDQEGGRVQRLPLDKSDFPDALSVGKSPEDAFEYGNKLGESVSSFNLNMNLAPVMDIFSNPQNKVIGNRAFGRTPQTVAFVGVDVMKGIMESGIIACIKHFPGHGDTLTDSHVGLPVIEHDLDRLQNFEWIPFKRAIDAGAEVVMTAHVLIPALDQKYPATLSYEIITHQLRETLGFGGVVMTDDLIMGAISKQYTYQEAVEGAISAGVDMVLISDNDYIDDIQAALNQALVKGSITEERIDHSLRRILHLKYQRLIGMENSPELENVKIN